MMTFWSVYMNLANRMKSEMHDSRSLTQVSNNTGPKMMITNSNVISKIEILEAPVVNL